MSRPRSVPNRFRARTAGGSRPPRSAVLSCCGLVLLAPLLTSAYVPPRQDAAAVPGGVDVPRVPDDGEAGGTIPGWPVEHPALSLSTRTDPRSAHPGDPLTQSAVVANTGDAALFGIVVSLGSGPCHDVLGRLRPGDSRTVTCAGTAPTSGRVAARAVGMTHTGFAATARATAEVVRPAPPPAPPAPARPSVALDILPARNGSVPVRVRNTSAVRLLDVAVTGEPPACRRSFDALEPGEEVTYTCPARPGEVVRLAVTARSLAGEVTAADATLVLPTPAAPPAAPAPAAEPPRPAARPEPPPLDPPVRELADSAGPRESPAPTAGFIAVLGVLVMMVSIGALSSATRPSK
ncbi:MULTISPECIES: hypothetical protein [unclassified Saccharopolyspora]|uniref:hypothetical protein n=1 Tax=unclassified Saccharopolyspora TaxID=2646250 RepID=UPI001CD75D14|nr:MULTISPECIES: hypothetical protein [unclassified Saccharopolyspora]MCA1187053.1 hypothetical protein [Saccharopolyspora sp. 6T]MCA1191919.1 hypothetical protein [Saccharopolyspora sp. 6V]MCA1224842.1 hypothetical protein [Saccharopolyspora sp. 6M]MCA1280190.1 hypothetical protein [Saccharopolyspora sp. 7B]